MADAIFYDGEPARRRHVTLRICASALTISEGEDWLAAWPLGSVRRRESQEEFLRLAIEGGPALARLEVTDPDDQAAVRAACPHLDSSEMTEPLGRIIFWSTAAALSVVLTILFLIPLLADRLTSLIPPATERRLGRAVDNHVRLLFGKETCGQPKGVAALTKLVGRLQTATGEPLAIDVAVLDSEVENAIALPGGRIYLFKGLLGEAQSVDEIAGVLAHEIAHVVHRDGLRELIKSSATSYLIGLLLGDVSGGGSAALVTTLVIDSAHSREAEQAADAFASRTMLSLGRPPEAMAVLIRRIEGEGGQMPPILRTHPPSESRLQALQRDQPKTVGDPLLGEEEWRALKEICMTS